MTAVQHTLRNLSTKIVVTSLSFIIYLFIPNLIGADLFGTFSFISALIGLIIPLTSCGIGAGIIYYLSNKQFEILDSMPSVTSIALILAIINGLVMLFLFGIGMFYKFDPLMQNVHLTLLIIGIFFQTMSFVIGRAFFGNSDFKILNLVDLVSTIANPLLLIFLMFILGKDNRDFIYFSFCSFSVLIFLINLYFILRFKLFGNIKLDFVKASLKYGLKSWSGDLALRANLRLDQLILGYTASSTALGIYSVAVRLVELVWIIPDAIGRVLFNLIARLNAPSDSVQLIARLHRILFFVCTCILAIWILVCYYLIIPYILGSGFEKVIYLLLLLAPGTLLLISSKIFTKLFSASGNVHWTSQITIFGSVIAMVGYFLLIPIFGMQGAAISSSIGYICLAMAGLYIMKVNYNIKLKEYYWFYISDYFWLKNKIDTWRSTSTFLEVK